MAWNITSSGEGRLSVAPIAEVKIKAGDENWSLEVEGGPAVVKHTGDGRAIVRIDISYMSAKPEYLDGLITELLKVRARCRR